MNTLQETIHRYFKARKEVVAAYIYGSHATGKQKAFSDVDIGVVYYHQDLIQSSALQSQYTVDLGRQLRKDVHVVNLNTTSELLLSQIFKKGICVCSNNDAEFKQFKMIRFSMISEFGYYLKMTQAGFRRKMMEEHPHG